MADALATLASMYQVNAWNDVPKIIVQCLDRPTHVFVTKGASDKNFGIMISSISFRLRNTQLVH